MHISEEISKELGKTPAPCNPHSKSNSDRRGRGKILNLTEVKPQMPERSLQVTHWLNYLCLMNYSKQSYEILNVLLYRRDFRNFSYYSNV